MRNKLFGRTLIAAAVCLISLSACSDDAPDGGNEGGSSSSLKLDRLDIAGAKALTLMGTPSKSRDARQQSALFKMDQDGNLSAVILHVTEAEDGGKTTDRTDITVHPGEIFSLSGKYTYLYDCRFYDGKGNGVGLAANYDDPGTFYFNILVAKNTGKIYYVNDAAHQHFPARDNDEDKSAVDKQGNLYLYHTGTVAKLTFSGDKAELATYGPEQFAQSGGLYILDNGVVAVPTSATCSSFTPTADSSISAARATIPAPAKAPQATGNRQTATRSALSTTRFTP